MSTKIEEQAKYLARENRKAEPSICKIYWFRDNNEVRLVELLEEMPVSSDGKAYPMYFREAPNEDIFFPSAIALLSPVDDKKADLPDSWGSWDAAVVLWEKSNEVA